jgi:hypothetical protein
MLPHLPASSRLITIPLARMLIASLLMEPNCLAIARPVKVVTSMICASKLIGAQMEHENDKLLAPAEASAFLERAFGMKVNPRSLCNMRCLSSDGPAYHKIGARVFYRESSLRDFANRNISAPRRSTRGAPIARGSKREIEETIKALCHHLILDEKSKSGHVAPADMARLRIKAEEAVARAGSKAAAALGLVFESDSNRDFLAIFEKIADELNGGVPS